MDERVSWVGVLGALACLAAALWIGRRSALRQRARGRLADAAPGKARPARPAARTGTPVARAGAASLLALLVGLGGLLLGWDLPIASGSAALAGVLLHAALAVLAQRRALRLEEGLAEVIGLVSSGLRVGASPLEALERAADAVGGPARSLLLDLSARLRLGEEPEAALEELTRRVPLESFRLFSLALAVQWRAGGSLQRSLATVGRSIRNRVQVARRIHSQSASTRGSVVAFTVATAAVALLMWQYDPGNLERFLSSGSGAALLGGALWLQALAILWMSRLTRVQV